VRQLLKRCPSGVEPTQYEAMLADYAESIVDLADKADDFHIHSGTSFHLMDGAVRGQYDFMLECELQPHADMSVLEPPVPSGMPLPPALA
jgi:hypothetical protein